MLSKIYKYGLVASIIIFFSKLKNSIINGALVSKIYQLGRGDLYQTLPEYIFQITFMLGQIYGLRM